MVFVTFPPIHFEKISVRLILAFPKIAHSFPLLKFIPIDRRENSKKSNSRTWALDVADNATRGVVHELDADLGDTTTGT